MDAACRKRKKSTNGSSTSKMTPDSQEEAGRMGVLQLRRRSGQKGSARVSARNHVGPGSVSGAGDRRRSSSSSSWRGEKISGSYDERGEQWGQRSGEVKGSYEFLSERWPRGLKGREGPGSATRQVQTCQRTSHATWTRLCPWLPFPSGRDHRGRALFVYVKCSAGYGVGAPYGLAE